MSKEKADILTRNSIFIWIATATVAILLVPLIAMRFSTNVNWSLSDFIIIGTLLYVGGSLFVLTARRFRRHRMILGILLGAVVLWLWAELAVGVFTNWGN